MRDYAHEWTDEQIEKLVRRFDKEYSQAAREMRKKLEDALADYGRENAQRLKSLDDTPEARKLYEEWKRGQAASQAWMNDMVHQLSESAVNANMHAADMINDRIPRVYAESSNMAAYAIDSQLGIRTGFTLVNEDAVRYLMGMPLKSAGDDQLLREVTWTPEETRRHVQDLRKREVDYPKDMRWNRERFHSAITQGILQGESIPNIVKRTNDIYGRNRNSAIRAARTATTNAENAGRMATFERAQKLGIDLKAEWMATLDNRTRDSHRALDGERIQLGEKFSNGLRWPADPYGPASETWNCRCTMVAAVDGQDYEGDSRWSKLPDGMTYEEWKRGAPKREAPTKEEKPTEKPQPKLAGVTRGKPMTFKQANELRGNPNYNLASKPYDEYQKAIRNYNRVVDEYGFSSRQFNDATIELGKAQDAYKQALRQQAGYRNNCQTCVVANEARRRGYDVQATPNTKGSQNERLSRRTNLAWVDPSTGKHPEYMRYDGAGRGDSFGKPIPTHKRCMEWLTSDGTIEEGARYTMEFTWKGRDSSGHIVSIERTEGGLRMYDPQCGMTYNETEISAYMKNIRMRHTRYGTTYADGPMLLKVSDYKFDEICDQILIGASE